MKKLRTLYRRWRKGKEIFPLYWYNFKRFVRFSSSRSTQEAWIGHLTMAIHGIEKGLTMGNLRLGFGQDRLRKCLGECERFIARYGTEDVQLQHLAVVVNDYDLLHRKAGFSLQEELQARIDRFLARFDCPADSEIQQPFTREEYFAHTHADFAEFARSRHSCRHFTEEPVPMETIDKAVALAQTAPSACNRQPARVYVVASKEKMAKVLALHGGNRGFADQIDKLILVCGYLPCYHTTERDCVYTDCGIFTMNLAYALHYYGVGACILNWSAKNENDRACRRILPVRDEEVICTLIACGQVPERFKVCNSRKKALESILHHIV